MKTLCVTKITTLSGIVYETAFVSPEDKVNYRKQFRCTPYHAAFTLLKQHCKDNGFEKLIVTNANGCSKGKEYTIKK